MLLLNRTLPTLSDEEQHLSSLIPIPTRTAPRPTDQRSGELTGTSLDTFTAPSIADDPDAQDIPFSPVPDDLPPSMPSPPTSPVAALTGISAMHIKHYEPGGCLLHAFTTELALLALALRHTAVSDSFYKLTPLMPTTLEGLATTFEMATLITLEQSGHLHLAEEATLKAEDIQALCQRVVTEGIERRVKVAYEPTPPTE
jgi:hypothetical protein